MKTKFLVGFICVIILFILFIITFGYTDDYSEKDPTNIQRVHIVRKNELSPADLRIEQAHTTEQEIISSETDDAHLQYINENDTSCYDAPSDMNSFMEFDSSKEKESMKLGRNIFFHETTCFGRGEARFNARQACAVESAAKMNPSMNVYILFLSPSKISKFSNHLIQQLLSYDNIKIRRMNINEYMKHTPLEEWYARGIWKSSLWPTIQTADILRFVTLWKFGGIYLDLDVVIMKSLEDLENFTGVQDEGNIAAGVMGFGMGYLGRRVADDCLEDLKTNFVGNIWGNNAPGVITRVLQKLCNVTRVSDMTPFRCDGFMSYPPSVLYPIPYQSWMEYFDSEALNRTMKIIEESRAIHVWNKLSKLKKVEVGSEIPYAKVAAKYCPKVYNNCGPIF